MRRRPNRLRPPPSPPAAERYAFESSTARLNPFAPPGIRPGVSRSPGAPMNGSPKLHKQKDGRAGWRLMWAMLALLAAFPALADCDACAATARRFAVDQHFNGVILVGHGSQVDYAESFGAAAAATRQPLTADTPFETGSISKWIASSVVMRLVQQGELALDEPISTYLPDYRRCRGDSPAGKW